MQIQTGHIGLNVTDVTKSSDFYQRLLGLEVVGEGTQEGRRFAFLGSGGATVLTLWQQSQGSFSGTEPGLHHLSFQASDMAEVRRVAGVAKELGATFHYDDVVAHGEGAASGGVYFTDPDGIRLEVFAATGAEGLAAPTAGAPSCGLF